MEKIVGTPAELTAQSVVEVVVPALAPALAFYLDVGFTVERRTSSFVVLRYDDAFLFLAEDPEAPTTRRWTNVRIVVPDVDAVWRRIQERGLNCHKPIADRPYGLRDFIVRDPAGFEVRFAQPVTRDSRQS
jgi:uncharacterized glyoxalase superfamily protein PhnB